MKKQYSKGHLILKVYRGIKKIIKKKKPTCQTPGCSNLCTGRKDVYCPGCIKNTPTVHVSTVPVNQTPQLPSVTVNQTPPPQVIVNQTPQLPSVTVNKTPSPPLVTVNQPPQLPSVFVNKTPSPPPVSVNQTILPPPSKPTSSPVINKTKMILLKSNDIEYLDIQQSFRLGLPRNTILGIFKLNIPTNLVRAHDQYKAVNANMPNLRAFHGTKSICSPKRFITNPKAEFCKSACGACGIAQHGNKVQYSGDKLLWFANNSSVSLYYCNNGYARNNKPYTATENSMFVVDIITNQPGPVYTTPTTFFNELLKKFNDTSFSMTSNRQAHV
ncbi:23021_t:CDS:2 [Cetraspora pellucida]|uniref:23021_t:CDS:1 n=1 Tax=Cetraspora pellucida TaxID=1433469 RepID=A0A9N9B844_9GLOM|nr:23021_t:CDS:2 [Cetraspora pellucida]